MPFSKRGPEELEPFLSVFDQQDRSNQLVREPAYAARLQGIYNTPVSANGVTYGRALEGRNRALHGLALQDSGARAMGEVRTDLRKDAARRTYMANQAELAQRLENMRGKSIGAFTNLLTQSIGAGTAPIRPGGEKHGEFTQALETAGLNMESQQEEQRARMVEAEEARREFIEHVQRTQGRYPNLSDWDVFAQYRRGN